MILLGFRLDKSLKEELENNFENELTFAENITDFIEYLKNKKYETIVIEERNLQEEALINLVKKVGEHQKKGVIIILGETSNLKVVAGSVKAGAYDYILKPVDNNTVIKIIEKSVKDYKLLAERVDKHKSSGDKLIGQTKEIVELYKMIGKVASSRVPVLVVGEKGTGKTSVAKSIHQFSDWSNEPLISINCTSFQNELLERKMFGYEKGAFTGANSKGKKGLFETANKGTLLLDEISELPLSAQSKLLHVLQEQKYLPIGGNKPIEIDVKIIAATNKDLRTLVFNKQFREDLYYRLNVIELYLPPLRERKEDISFLIKSFIEKFNKKYFFSKSFTKEALEILEAAQWKGNIRELQHAIERLMVTNDSSIIGVEHLSERLPNHSSDKNSIEEDFGMSFDEKVSHYEANLIKEAYQKFKTSRKVAQYLKISQTKANKLIRKYINNNSL